MNVINFSHNWNGKLNNKYFTTIRKRTGNKYEYYHSRIGEIFSVRLKGKEVGKAKLIEVEWAELIDIPDALLTIDTGTEKFMDVFRKFGIGDFDIVLILTFKKEVVADESR